MEEPKSEPKLEATMLPWPSWIEVDLDAIRDNVRAIRAFLPPTCQVMAVVKAQAYGHGAVAVSMAAVDAGATCLAVARVREGVQLRKAGLDVPILLLGPFDAAEAPLVAEHRLCPTLVSMEQARAVSRAARACGTVLTVHVKVDTGLGRYGGSLEDLRRLLPEMAQLSGLRLEGLYSHFATADEPESEYAAFQVETFRAARAALEADGFRFPMVHMAASAATMALGESHLDAVRVGLSLYGLYPAPHLAGRVPLRPALTFHSRVAKLFRLEAGQSVGYGRAFVAEGEIGVALVPLGYADGLPRAHSNRGFVLVNGRRAPILGRISMDQCVVDVSGCGMVREGDPVVVIGAQGEENIRCEEFAERSGTISYEVFTSLGYRVPRAYRSGGRVVAIAYLDEGRLEEWP